METTGNNKTSSPTFIKKTPAGRYTAQKSETIRKYQTLKNIIGHRDSYKIIFLRETQIGWLGVFFPHEKTTLKWPKVVSQPIFRTY